MYPFPFYRTSVDRLEALYFCPCVVVLQDLFVVIALLAHDGSTDLAEADAMTPAVAVEDEATGDAVPNVLCLDGEGAALQGRGTEHTAYL